MGICFTTVPTGCTLTANPVSKKKVISTAIEFANESGQQIPAHQQQLDQIKQQHQEINGQVTLLQQQKTQLTADTTTLQQQKTKLNDELASIQKAHQKAHQLANDISSLSQQRTQITTEFNTLQAQVNELKKQIADILGSTGANQLRNVVEGISDSEAQVLQLDKSSYPQQFKDHLKDATNRFVKTFSEKLSNIIEQNKTTLTKKIEDNEKAVDTMKTTMLNAQAPENVIQRVVEEYETHITSLREQLGKWNTYKDKLAALPSSG